MIKKSLIVLTILSMIFIGVSTTGSLVNTSPVENPHLTVSPPMYVAKALGEAFTININISNAQNLRVYEFTLGYNTTLLDAVGVVQGPFFPSPPKASIEKRQINDAMGFVCVRVSISGSEPTVSGSGTLATITFDVILAPTQPAYSVLDLRDTSLYDGSMTTIVHDSTDGLYFWKSIQADPPLEGRLLDLTTQKGGIGQGVPGGEFTLGEVVGLYGKLTYNEFPVQNKLVVFTVVSPKGDTVLVQADLTQSLGDAGIEFRIPFLSGSLGKWTALANAEVAEKLVWDSLTFDVSYQSPPHGPQAIFIESTENPYEHEAVRFDASASIPGWNGTAVLNITEYRWNFGDGNTTTTSTPIVYHAYEHVGIYSVTLTVYAPKATPTTNTAPIQKKNVHAAPVGGYSYYVSTENPTTAKPTALYSILVAIIVAAFASVRRKTRVR